MVILHYSWEYKHKDRLHYKLLLETGGPMLVKRQIIKLGTEAS